MIPLPTEHYRLLQRNLIYTGITRGKRLLVLIGQKKALGIAVRNDRPQRRYSGLLASLRGNGQMGMAPNARCDSVENKRRGEKENRMHPSSQSRSVQFPY